jgi:hypothetical protein
MASGRGGALRSLLEGPAPPRVRSAALASSYVIRRDDRGRTVLARTAGAGAEVELARSGRRRTWQHLAEALLGDALGAHPPRRLVSDYARFLVTPQGGTRTVAGAELQAWLETWRPSVLAVLASGR